MKLLNIALLLILSLNAFAHTPVEEVASPEASSSKIFSQISPNTHKAFLVSKLAYVLCALWHRHTIPNKNNVQPTPRPSPTLFSFEKISSLNASARPYISLLRYISQHLFTLHVEDKIYSKSQLSTENHYIRPVIFGTFLITLYDLGFAICRKASESKGICHFLTKSNVTILAFTYEAHQLWLQYKTIRALEDPKNYKTSTAAKIIPNALLCLSAICAARNLYSHEFDIFSATCSFLAHANLYAQTLLTQDLITAAEHHIATQQSQA
jgi:hypothetical protein